MGPAKAIDDFARLSLSTAQNPKAVSSPGRLFCARTAPVLQDRFAPSHDYVITLFSDCDTNVATIAHAANWQLSVAAVNAIAEFGQDQNGTSFMNFMSNQAKALCASYGAPVANGPRLCLKAEDAKTVLANGRPAFGWSKRRSRRWARKGLFKEPTQAKKAVCALQIPGAPRRLRKPKNAGVARIVTHQTGPLAAGQPHLLEAAAACETEIVYGPSVDRASSRIKLVCSTEGGMDNRRGGRKHPEKILSLPPWTPRPATSRSTVARRSSRRLKVRGQASSVLWGCSTSLHRKRLRCLEIKPAIGDD